MMLPAGHWATDFSVEDDDIDFLVNLLLEKEVPLQTRELASILVERRLADETAAIEARYSGTRVYDPAETYAPGDRLVFTALEFSTGTVEGLRDGDNPQVGAFKVLRVAMDNGLGGVREFAAELQQPHALSEFVAHGVAGAMTSDMTVEDVMEAVGDKIAATLDAALEESATLVRVARHWFPVDLMIEVNEGHLNLAEAVLDMMEGGPLPTDTILDQIGGISENSAMSLQIFSLNYYMNQDKRFDEVGPMGEVLWYLRRLEPEGVRVTPPYLRYQPLPVDRDLLTAEMQDLESEIGDEHSPLRAADEAQEATVTLIYPHRRAGTLPLNNRLRPFFPSAEKSERIYITLVDAEDGEEYAGWVVPDQGYIYGLGAMYNKHALPIGSYVTVRRDETPDRVLLDFHLHRAHTEWVRLLQPKAETITFENSKRSIGAEYDDLVILGVDDLTALDDLVAAYNNQRRTLVSLLKSIVPGLGRLNPQGTAHVKTIYSAVNVIRRCPPAPIMATLEANPEFENLGSNYWRLVSE